MELAVVLRSCLRVTVGIGLSLALLVGATPHSLPNAAAGNLIHKADGDNISKARKSQLKIVDKMHSKAAKKRSRTTTR
jgi:hypothetical protein